MKLDLKYAALVVVDPRLDLMDTPGSNCPTLGDNGAGHRTAGNLCRLFMASRRAGITIAVSLTSDCTGEDSSGLMPELQRYLGDDGTLISSPHRPYSPLARVNDLGLRLRQRQIRQIVLAGIFADFCIEPHLRDFQEQGFVVAVVRDAISGSSLPEGAGYLSALVNFRRIANALWTTEEAVMRLAEARPRIRFDPARGLDVLRRARAFATHLARPERSPVADRDTGQA